jgi:hypothetical protein
VEVVSELVVLELTMATTYLDPVLGVQTAVLAVAVEAAVVMEALVMVEQIGT